MELSKHQLLKRLYGASVRYSLISGNRFFILSKSHHFDYYDIRDNYILFLDIANICPNEFMKLLVTRF